MGKTPTYPLGLPDEQRDRWQEAAKARGLTLAAWVRESCEMRIASGNAPAERKPPSDWSGQVERGAKRFRGEDPKVKPRPRPS